MADTFIAASILVLLGLFGVSMRFRRILSATPPPLPGQPSVRTAALKLIGLTRILWGITLGLAGLVVVSASVIFHDRLWATLSTSLAELLHPALVIGGITGVTALIFGEFFSTMSPALWGKRIICLVLSPFLILLLPFAIISLPFYLLARLGAGAVSSGGGYEGTHGSTHDWQPSLSPFTSSAANATWAQPWRDTAPAAAPRAGFDINYPNPAFSANSWENNPNNPTNRGWNWNKSY